MDRCTGGRSWKSPRSPRLPSSGFGVPSTPASTSRGRDNWLGNGPVCRSSCVSTATHGRCPGAGSGRRWRSGRRPGDPAIPRSRRGGGWGEERSFAGHALLFSLQSSISASETKNVPCGYSPAPPLSYVLWHWSEALAALGGVREAVESADRALELAQRLKHREWTAASLRGLGVEGGCGRPRRSHRGLPTLSGGLGERPAVRGVGPRAPGPGAGRGLGPRACGSHPRRQGGAGAPTQRLRDAPSRGGARGRPRRTPG